MVIGLHIISVAELKRFLDLKQKNEPEQTKSCRRGTMPGSMSVVILDSTMKDTPLIIYSAMQGADEINKAKEAGAQDYLRKPEDIANIHMIVAEWLKRRRH